MSTSKKIELPDGNIFEGTLKNGKPEGKGKLWTKGGSFYEGNFKNGEFNGKGKIEYDDGDIYEGDWKNGERHGKGKMIYHDGDIYEGDWKNGNMDGKGSIYNQKVSKNINFYEGDWKENEKQGNGKMNIGISFDHRSSSCYGKEYRLYATYEGKFNHGEPTGEGKYFLENGDIIEGNRDQYVNTNIRLFIGSGSIHSPSGDIYEGGLRLSDGYVGTLRCQGKGKMIYSNGDIYEGNRNDGEFNGKGKMMYANGNIYEGEWGCSEELWVHGYLGHGKLTFKSGIIFDGEWYISEHWDSDDYEKGYTKKGGTGKIIYPNGDVYIGEWEVKGKGGNFLNEDDWIPKGNRTVKYSDGHIFEGRLFKNFNSDVLSGKGKIKYPNGDIYEGEVENNEKNGMGIMKYANGCIYKGPRRNDKRRTVKYGYGEEGGCLVTEDDDHGILIFPDGSYYDGERFADNPQVGAKYDKDGKIIDDDYMSSFLEDNDYDCIDNFGDEYDINKNYFFDEEACCTYNFKNLLNELENTGNYEKKYFGNGDAYVGELKNNLPNGLGKMYYHNDDIYQGFRKDGKYDGIGEIIIPKNKDTGYLYDVSNYRYIGNLKLIGGTEMHKIKHCYGKRTNGKLDGYARFSYRYREMYEGHRTNGERNGVFIDTHHFGNSNQSEYELYRYRYGQLNFPYISYEYDCYGNGKMFLNKGDCETEIIDLKNLNNYKIDIKNDVLKCLKLPDVREVPTDLNNMKAILFFDTETTGLSENSSIIQFGGIYGLLLGNKFIELYRINQYIDVIQKIEKEAYETHHISSEFLKKYHYFERYVDKLLPLFKNADLIVGHNIKFDIEMMRKECERLGIYINWDKLKVFDTMRNTIKLVGTKFEDGWYKWPKLQELYVKLFGKNFDDAHSAIADVEATRDCFLKLLSEGYMFNNLGFKGLKFEVSDRSINPLSFASLGEFKHGINSITLTKYDEWGFDEDGFNIFGYNKDGIDKNGIDRIGYDEDGYDKDGIDKNGFNREGKQIFNEDGYDKNGYNREGYNRDGFDKYGYDEDGYTAAGKERQGFYPNFLFNRYDKHGFDKKGIHKDTGIRYDKKGFMRNGYNRFTRGPFDENGLDIDEKNFKNSLL